MKPGRATTALSAWVSPPFSSKPNWARLNTRPPSRRSTSPATRSTPRRATRSTASADYRGMRTSRDVYRGCQTEPGIESLQSHFVTWNSPRFILRRQQPFLHGRVFQRSRNVPARDLRHGRAVSVEAEHDGRIHRIGDGIFAEQPGATGFAETGAAVGPDLLDAIDICFEAWSHRCAPIARSRVERPLGAKIREPRMHLRANRPRHSPRSPLLRPSTPGQLRHVLADRQ